MRIALILTAILILPALTAADIPDFDFCTITIPDGPTPRYCMVVPDGSGPSLAEARIAGGDVFSAVITVTLINNMGDPVEGYPAEDVWMASDCGDLVFCDGVGIADSDTDVNGQTTFSGPLSAGGFTEPDCGVVVLVAGTTLPVAPLELYFMSPDITGDLVVNLSDITLFAQALAGYAYEADYNADGVVNLTDIALMAQALGAVCP